MTNKIRFAAALLVVGLAAVCASAQAPTLRIQTDDPNLPSDLYYGNVKVKPLRLRPGTNQPVTIDDAPVCASELVDGKMLAPNLLVATKLAASKNEARRKISEGAVTVGPDRRKVTDPNDQIAVETGLVVRLGRKIVRVKLA